MPTPFSDVLSLLFFFENVFACAAKRAFPVVRKICKCSTRSDAIVRIAFCRIIYITAKITFVFHSKFLPYISFTSPKCRPAFSPVGSSFICPGLPGRSFMSHEASHNLARIAAGHDVVRNIMRHHTSGSDYNIAADIHAR